MVLPMKAKKAAPQPAAVARPAVPMKRKLRRVRREGSRRIKKARKSTWRKEAQAAVAFFDPWKNAGRPLYVPHSVGAFTTFDYTIRFTITLDTASTQLMIIQWTPSKLRGAVFKSTASTIQPLIYAQEYLSSNAPNQIRPMRMGVSIKNVTRADQIAGTVVLLNTSDDLDFYGGVSSANGQLNFTTTPNYDAFANAVKGHEKSHVLSAHELAFGRRTTTRPVSTVGMSGWRDWCNITTYNGSNASQVDTETLYALNQGNTFRNLSNVAVFFPNVATMQTYEVEVRGQDALTFSFGHLANKFAKDPPLGSPEWFDKMVTAHKRWTEANPPIPPSMG